jgi:Uma2 family endonuclease
MKAAEQRPVKGGELWPLSVAGYHTLSDAGLIPERTELLYGQVYHKMSKSPLHSYLVQLLQDMLLDQLPGGYCLRVEQPLTLGDSEPEPDLALFKGKASDFRLRHPTVAELVIEICVTTHDFDRSKLPAYAAAGIPECWLFLGPEKQVEVYRKPSGGRYTEKSISSGSQELTSVGLAWLKVPLDKVFA